ncbi:MAG TPA: hypothetical protein VGQ76_20495 [Thermoanaerobaculia bacterium]|jgi:hypothetical protein|nr:hypothetical protein [Thermoanaerobaculia bacterium]
MIEYSFAALLVLLILESILAIRWNRAYYTYGLPIYVRRIERPRGLADVDLETLVKGSATVAGAQMVFQRLSPDLIAFRERVFGGLMHYTPIMSGVIVHRTEESAVVVVGRVKWFVVAFVVTFVVWMGKDFIDIAPFIVGALAVIYLIQAVRFSRVAKALQQ